MVNVDQDTFQSEVIEKSKSAPVLVDFWAPWCGPCRMLGPVLEKLELEHQGKWHLVKVNTDEQQALAGAYNVSGIPHCVLFSGGEPVDQFTGALPEHMLQDFLSKHIKDESMQKLEALASSDPVAAVRQILEMPSVGQGLSPLLWNGVKEMLRQGNTDDLKEALEAITSAELVQEKAALLNVLASDRSQEEIQQLGKLFASEKEIRDVLDQFMESLERNKGKQEKERLIASFHLLGQSHPLVAEYRKKMATILF
ncbi:MAG: thioredoxin [Leptospiraceae bacterium]|nr:thioredoxin [Leptospiraceae bacterium]